MEEGICETSENGELGLGQGGGETCPLADVTAG